MTDRDYDDKAARNRAEQEELDEWRRWAESWLEDVDEEYGAGEEGTDQVVNKYKNQTPGQGEDEHNSR